MQFTSVISQSKPPKLDSAAYLKLLRDITSEAEAAVRSLDEAVRQSGGREAAAAARTNVAHLLRHDLAGITAAACARAGASLTDAVAAHAYWGDVSEAGDGNESGEVSSSRREISEAERTLKSRLGKHLLTRRSAIAAIEVAHEAQATSAEALVDGALRMCGGDPQGAEFQMALQHLSQRVANEACLADAGVGLQELMAFATKEVGADDAFRRAFESAVETCGARVQAALNGALLAILSGGSGGGGGLEG